MRKQTLIGLGLMAFAAGCGGGTVTTSNAELRLEPASVQFGRVTVGHSEKRILKLVNDGNQGLTVESIELAAPYRVGKETPFQVDAASKVELEVFYEPVAVTAAGAPDRATLVVVNDSPNNPRASSELVGEGAFDGLQASPRYPAGLALRFARVKRYRADKRPEEADTIDAVRALFRAARAREPNGGG